MRMTTQLMETILKEIVRMEMDPMEMVRMEMELMEMDRNPMIPQIIGITAPIAMITLHVITHRIAVR